MGLEIRDFQKLLIREFQKFICMMPSHRIRPTTTIAVEMPDDPLFPSTLKCAREILLAWLTLSFCRIISALPPPQKKQVKI